MRHVLQPSLDDEFPLSAVKPSSYSSSKQVILFASIPMGFLHLSAENRAHVMM